MINQEDRIRIAEKLRKYSDGLSWYCKHYQDLCKNRRLRFRWIAIYEGKVVAIAKTKEAINEKLSHLSDSCRECAFVGLIDPNPVPWVLTANFA